MEPLRLRCGPFLVHASTTTRGHRREEKGVLQEKRGEWPIRERREPHNKRRRSCGDGRGLDKTNIEQDGWRSVELRHWKKGK